MSLLTPARNSGPPSRRKRVAGKMADRLTENQEREKKEFFLQGERKEREKDFKERVEMVLWGGLKGS
uniref:Uncharacterized protein n=1 Tax=Rhizophora mucronata TaxID=61149 RepID=A0A2P2P3B5_RHIMU